MSTPPATALPEDLLRDIRSMLEAKDYPLAAIGREYFVLYKSFIQPSRFGLTSWREILTHPDLSEFIEVTPDDMVRKRRPVQNGTIQTPSTSASSNLVRNPLANGNGTQATFATPTVPSKRVSTEPEAPGTSANLLKRPRDEPMNVDVKSQTSTDITDRTHVTILPHNQQKLERERRNQIEWIPRDGLRAQLNFNTLIRERVVEYEEAQTHVDCTYCERTVLENLMSVKDDIRKVGIKKFAEVRNEYNQFEFSDGGIFQHGEAIKMANIDALMDFGLSNPKAMDGKSLLQPKELLYFVDVYGGPGGYIEYFLWKKKWQAKAFGISQKGSSTDYDFKQAEHFPRESFEPYYGGDTGLDGDGSISRPFNVAKFTTFVRKSTDEKGVHFMIASASDRNDYVDEDQREIRAKYTILAELLIALQVVRTNGHFVCRIYDMYTPFTVGLIYLMYRTFERVAVFKPESSLPASSEKYVICQWKKDNAQTREVMNYLQECHKVDWLSRRNSPNQRRRNDPIDILELVSRERMNDSNRFCMYIQQVNAKLGRRQYHETRELANKIQYNRHKVFIQGRLDDIKHRLLHLWGVPQNTRVKPKYASASTPLLRAQKLVTPYNFDFFAECERTGEEVLTLENMEIMKNSVEWSFMPVGKDRGFFLCLGGNDVYKFSDGSWNKIHEKIELMNNTLVYADFVDELKFEGATSTLCVTFHIIDALVLGGKDVRNLNCGERFDLIGKYCKSMNKLSRADLATVRFKEHYEPKNCERIIRQIESGQNIRHYSPEEFKPILPVEQNTPSEYKFRPCGLLFMKVYKDNFAAADVRFAMQNRLFWDWKITSGGVELTLPENVSSMEVDEDKTRPIRASDLVNFFKA